MTQGPHLAASRMHLCRSSMPFNTTSVLRWEVQDILFLCSNRYKIG